MPLLRVSPSSHDKPASSRLVVWFLRLLMVTLPQRGWTAGCVLRPGEHVKRPEDFHDQP